MKAKIRGQVYILGNDVDTDQIIPAHHLVYSLDDPEERILYGTYALSGVPEEKAGLPEGRTPFIEPGKNRSEFSILVAGQNFGCGSSREHAPFALRMAGIRVVIAVSYARIFYRNAVDGSYFIPLEVGSEYPKDVRTSDTIEIDCKEYRFTNLRTGKTSPLKPLGEVEEIIDAGGIFAYARRHGMLA